MAAEICDVDMCKRGNDTQIQAVAAPAFTDNDECPQQVPPPAAQASMKHDDSKGKKPGWKGESPLGAPDVGRIHKAASARERNSSSLEGCVYSSLDLSSCSLYM